MNTSNKAIRGLGNKNAQKYNMINRRIYQCWVNMKSRCDKDNRKDSKYYCLKGITYCDEWRSYENFQEWALNNGYSDNLTLDRINSKGNYCPDNCRWITFQEQQRNRSCCIYFTHDGETKTLSEWAAYFDINRAALSDRIFKLGYSFEEAICKQKNIQKHSITYFFDGVLYSQTQFARLLKTSHKRLNKLRNMGYTPEEIVAELKGAKK